jgi:hypothetical protein
MQGGNRGKDPAGLNQRPHVPEEQGQKQGADVRSVDVRVGHDDDLPVTRGIQVERTTGARTDDLQDRRTLGVLEHVSQ